jgi:hypothetical protein
MSAGCNCFQGTSRIEGIPRYADDQANFEVGASFLDDRRSSSVAFERIAGEVKYLGSLARRFGCLRLEVVAHDTHSFELKINLGTEFAMQGMGEAREC